MALLDYRTTPLDSCGLSPAQLSMCRRPRNNVPTSTELLKPRPYDLRVIKKAYLKYYHDAKHPKNLPCLSPGDSVRMSPLPGTKQWVPATVVEHHNTPRSYIVERKGRKYRRNRQQLRIATQQANDSGGHVSPMLNARRADTTPTKPNESQQVANTTTSSAESRKAPEPVRVPKENPKGAPILPTGKRQIDKDSAPYYTSSGRLSQPPKKLNL